jgi:hypothetical protein
MWIIKIEGFYYRTTLSVKNPTQSEVKLAKFSKEFTITQFTGRKWMEEPHHTWGGSILYLRVPMDIKINGNIQFVGE